MTSSNILLDFAKKQKLKFSQKCIAFISCFLFVFWWLLSGFAVVHHICGETWELMITTTYIRSDVFFIDDWGDI